VNVAAEINKLRGEMTTGFAKVEGRFLAGQQVMLSLSTDIKRLEATVRESLEQGEEAQEKSKDDCKTCHSGLLEEIGAMRTELSATKVRQVFVAGAGAGIIGVFDLVLRAPALIAWLRG
jgi:hypothetical protein